MMMIPVGSWLERAFLSGIAWLEYRIQLPRDNVSTRFSSRWCLSDSFPLSYFSPDLFFEFGAGNGSTRFVAVCVRWAFIYFCWILS